MLGGIFKRGFVPDAITYTILIRGLLSDKKFVEAEELFKKLLRAKEIEPNVVIYGTIINGLCKTGNTSMAIRLLRVMERGSCEPNNVVYNTIIDSLCKDKLVDDTLDLFFEMIKKGIPPSGITYNTLLQGLCNLGRWGETKHILSEMNNMKVSPDVITFSILVDSYCKEGKVKDAEHVFEKMIQSCVNPDVVTYNSLVDGYCLRGEMDGALKVFNTMLSKGIVSDNYSYSILINGYCKRLEVNKAMDLFRQMHREGLKPSIVTYNTILQGLFKQGRYVAAQKFFYEMQAQGRRADILTCGILLKAFARTSILMKHCSFLRKWNGTERFNYRYLYLQYPHRRTVQRWKEIFLMAFLPKGMLRHTLMIRALCQEGLLEKANELLVEMEANGCLPDDVTYNTAIRGCFQNKKYEEASAFIETMVGRGFFADASTTSMLLDLLSTKEQDPSLLALRQKFLPSVR